MQLPSFTHGLTREVKRRSSRIITRLARQVPWAEAVAEVSDGEMLDTDDTEGLLVLHGPEPMLGSEPHFHLYLPLMMIFDAMSPRRGRLPLDREDELFVELLQHDWCVLALQGWGAQTWTVPERRHAPFFSATLRAWPAFPDEPRYTTGSNTGSWLWQCVPNIRSVIFHMGVPAEAMQTTMVRTRDELVALLESHDIQLDPAPST